MIRPGVFFFLLLPCGACRRPPPDADDELAEVAAAAFTFFDGDEGQGLSPEEVLQHLLDRLDAVLDRIDLDARRSQRVVALPPLTPEQWGTVEGPDPDLVDPHAQVPVALPGRSRHGLDTHVDLVLEPNQVCIQSDTTVYAARTFLDDTACFRDGTCAHLRTHTEVRKESALARVWYDTLEDFRTVSLTDGRRAVVGRSWNPERAIADGGSNSWDQLYGLDVRIEDAGGARRFLALWSSVRVAGLGDETFRGLVERGIEEAFSNADDFADGRPCANDRDRPYDRP